MQLNVHRLVPRRNLEHLKKVIDIIITSTKLDVCMTCKMYV